MSMDKRALFKSVMIGFMADEDPMLAMPKWISGQRMQIEAESKVGANKNAHDNETQTAFFERLDSVK